MTLLHSTRSLRRGALACGVMLAAGLFSVNARADEWTKRTILTVNQPIQVKDTVLQPGKYVLRLILNGTLGVDRHVVQIFDGNEMHIINTVVTQATVRPHATGNTQFTWWETPPGTAPALRDWYYPGEVTGDEFPYPNQPKQVATVVPPPPVNAPVATTTEPAAAPVAPPPEPQPETAEVQPAPSTPAAPPEPQAAPTPAPAPEPAANRETPENLPKTGSPFPLIAVCGFTLAGLGGALLRKRTA